MVLAMGWRIDKTKGVEWVYGTDKKISENQRSFQRKSAGEKGEDFSHIFSGEDFG